MKKIIIFIWTLLLFFWVSFAGFTKTTSWIRKITYQVKWCNSVFGCKTWYFSSLSTTVWPNYNNWFNVNNNWWTICSSNCTSAENIKNLFSNLKLKWEWVYTITVRVFDNVKYGKVKQCDGKLSNTVYNWDALWNCSELELVYKIDKTNPNIVNPWKNDSSYPQVNENSNYIYVGRSSKSVNVKVNNWVNGWYLDWEKFKKPAYNNIANTPWVKNIKRQNLKTIYYSNWDEQITINLNLQNYYNGENNYNTDWWSISKITEIKLLDLNHNVKKTWSIQSLTENWSINWTINSLFWNNVDEKVFYLRVYDEAWNFSETPLYIVKDTKAPITLNDFLSTFTFNWWTEKVFYTTDKKWPKIDWNKSIPSKFFAANDSLGLKFSISDKKEWGDNTHNSWILKFKFSLEETNSCWDYQNYIFNPADNLDQEKWTTIQQNFSITHNFSKVDKCLQDNNKTYRYYRAKIISIDDDGNKYPNKICDKVGNCTSIAPLVFRVVANKIDNDKSQIQISTENLLNWEKLIANGSSDYNLNLILKDKYGNKIVPVYSQDDSKEIKDVILTMNLKNGLYLDQINNSWPYATYVEDNQSDDDKSPNWKFSDKITLSEKTINPNWKYSISIKSYVPTKNYYPWLADTAVLKLTSINFNVQDKTSNWLQVKKDSIWQVNRTDFNSDKNEIVLDKWSLAYDNGVNHFLNVNSDDYWKIDSNPLETQDSFANKNKQIKFAFASPVIIWLKNLKNVSEWVKNTYSYNLWNIDNSHISKNNFSIIENWITNNPYDFYQWTWTTEVESRWVELIGKNFDNSVGNLSIIWTFNSNKKISKYTKISIDPDMASFVDPNDNHIALWTKINYQVWTTKVMLPSDWIWINGSNFDDSRKILDGTVSETNPSDYDDSELSPLTKNIKVLWTIATQNSDKNLLTTDRKRSIWWDVKKWNIRNKLIKKIANISIWQNWNNSCNAWDCDSFEINGEKIYLVDWDLTFAWDYEIDGKESYIVKWNVYIKWNVYKKDKKSLLSIVALNPDGFTRWTLSLSNIITSRWFIFIDPKITNIDAFIYAQWSLLSYDGHKIFNWSNTMDTDINIYNQLYIRWGIISSNTIWWSRLPDTNSKKCPWFVKDCNTNIAQAFDLVYLRRYMLVPAKTYWVGGSLSWTMIPYLPISVAPNISSYNSKKPYMWWKKYCELWSTSVDCTKDYNSNLKNIPNSWKEYPLYIEFDTSIKSNTPIVFTP